jgi:antibiotic biosynthesis monooxygenase
MVRAVYRWRVKAGEEEKFIQAWTRGTAAIRAKVKGAGGSLLMRSRHDLSEFMALACWNSMEDWQAFAAESDSAPPDPEAFRAMSGVSEHLSTEFLEEVADLLDCGP